MLGRVMQLDPLIVLIACGVPLERAASTLRFTPGTDTTSDDIDQVLANLPGIVERSRAKRAVGAAAG